MTVDTNAYIFDPKKHVFSAIDGAQIRDIVAQDSFDPRGLLDAFMKDPFLERQFRGDIVTRFGLNLETHTLMVLEQYIRYFSNESLPGRIAHGVFRLMLALHDIGKPRALLEGDKTRQHEFTVPLIRAVMTRIALPYEDSQLILALVSKDPLGGYIRSGRQDLECRLDDVRDMALQAHMPAREFFELLLIYYQVDAGAYTTDAGWHRALDHLFCFCPEEGTMGFSPDMLVVVNAFRERLERL